ncbi:hypothetical protein CDAR_117711 [Caerostris darwini]|uniref:PiggyBac transposable element-derived protein domain-containing protein n=1 Tax=Caerostris darwini TaxID=1538125 RepID=A0AAV4PZB1_9ARAC|nr:hypothetical protein CDAR_117711 [Caerostris darwini]
MPGREFNSLVQSVDKITVKFKGMSTMRQYLPGKPVKRGYKIWARSDAYSGYLSIWCLCRGKKTMVPFQKDWDIVITNLSNDLHLISLLLVVFEHFSSIDGNTQKTCIIGTIRTGRKSFLNP